MLGSILLDTTRLPEADFDADDLSLELHRQIFGSIHELQAAGEYVSYAPVYTRLKERRQAGSNTLSYLIALTSDLPRILDLGPHVRSIRQKATLRRAIFAAENFRNKCLIDTTTAPSEIVAEHLTIMQEVVQRAAPSQGVIQSIDDLESVFADDSPIEYLLEPELPRMIVTLTGESCAGKSTLACAWARDLNARGHACLYLDKDKNPRAVIRERLKRIGVHSDGPLFRVWDYEQLQEAPQPDSPVVVSWVKRMMAATGKPVLVIVDSLITFMGPDADENDNQQMRALFNRCRVLTRLDATVLMLHHPGKSENSKQGRGASDFKPASDLGFLVNNFNPDGSPLLHTLTLVTTKPRVFAGKLIYHYAGGKMVRSEEDSAVSRAEAEQFTGLLRTHPGVTQAQFDRLVTNAQLGRNKGRDFLQLGVQTGEIRVERNAKGPGHRYYLACDTSLQQDLEMDQDQDKTCVQ